MLKTLSLQEFTVFAQAEISFSPGINVIIGQNGSGKTHLLKVAYLFNRALADLQSQPAPPSLKRAEAYFEQRLINLFQSDYLTNLIRRDFREICKLGAKMDDSGSQLHCEPEKIDNFNCTLRISDNQVHFESWESFADLMARTHSTLNTYRPRSTFIPSKEIVSWHEGLVGLFDRYEMKLDASYQDLAKAMESAKLSTPSSLLAQFLADLKKELGGSLEFENNKLIFVNLDGSRTAPPMMAEGFRKLALLPYLIQHDAIKEKGETVFWDEPEANLNPSYIRWMAKALVCLAQEGVQVVIATHSLFLLREIDMLTKTGKIPARFISLTPKGNDVTIEQADDVEEIQSLASLEAELEQNDRIQAWYAGAFDARR